MVSPACNHINMWISFDVSSYNLIAYLGQNFIIKMSLYDSIRVDNDESRSYICKNFIFFVSLYEISQHFGLIEDVHLTHIIEKLALRHLKGLFNFGIYCGFAFRCLYFILHGVILQCFDGNCFEIGYFWCQFWGSINPFWLIL